MGLVYSVESRRLKRYERALPKEFDLSVLVSEVDKAHLVGADPAAIETPPYGLTSVAVVEFVTEDNSYH